MAKNTLTGYLPNDRPPFGQLVLLGFQHVLTMFPATAFVAALCGFHVGTVLLMSGLGTIVALHSYRCFTDPVLVILPRTRP
jgi:uracil permease